MTRREHGQTVQDILYLLGQFGPMTRVEICQQLDLDRRVVSSIVSRMGRASTRCAKRLHITGYTYDHEGERTYPRAIYALGNKQDAQRPVPDHKATKRRYNAKRKALNTANFVFNLALPRRVYERRV